MKKILLLLISMALVFSFVGCKDETLSVAIEDDNSASQFNFDLEGKTLTFSEGNSANRVIKTVTDATTNGTTETVIYLSTVDVSIVFSDLTKNDTTNIEEGTFTMTKSIVATADADFAFTDAGQTAYSGADFDNTGFAGKTMRTEVVSGTYQKLEADNKVEYYALSVTDQTRTNDPNATAGGVVPTTSSTYAAGTSTVYSSTPYTNVATLGPMEAIGMSPFDSTFRKINDDMLYVGYFQYTGTTSTNWVSNENFTVKDTK